MSHEISVRVIAALTSVVAIALSGCAQVGDRQQSDEEVRAMLARSGVDPSAVTMTDELVVVEGDMVFDRAKLLAGEYAGIGAGDDFVEKGYEFRDPGSNPLNSTVSSGFAANIRLVTDGNVNGFDLSTAVAFAGSAWSRDGLRMSASNTGVSITVHALDDISDVCPTGFMEAPAWACARFPTGSGSRRFPGAHVYVKRNPLPSPNKNCTTWTSTSLVAAVTHELGHAIGMTHMGTGFKIPGTTGCTSTVCPPSIMTPFVNQQSDCTVPAFPDTSQFVSKDDIASVKALF